VKERVALVVWCGACQSAGVARRGRLGTVTHEGTGAYLWRTEDRRLNRTNRPDRRWRSWRGGVVLTAPHAPDVELDVPERLPTLCPLHGRGEVDTRTVVEALAAGADSISITTGDAPA
jgi:hypothetical protein